MQIKDNTVRVLDDGFIELIGVFGNEKTIAQAARTSYGMKRISEEDVASEKDIALIKRLAKDKHTTPFEQVEMRFAIRCPMDTWRQWIRHRTANVNEYSTRYRPAIDSNQIVGDWRMQSTDNKQGSAGYLPAKWEDLEGVSITPASPGWNLVRFPNGLECEVPTSYSQRPCDFFSYRERQLLNLSRQVYEERLQAGIAREQARKDLPLSTYTEAWWKNDLSNILKFLVLRTAPDAQFEIRQYALAMSLFVKQEFPNVYDYYVEFMKVK